MKIETLYYGPCHVIIISFFICAAYTQIAVSCGYAVSGKDVGVWAVAMQKCYVFDGVG